MPAVPLKLGAHAPHLDLGLKTARDLLDRRIPADALPVTLDPLRRLLPQGLLRGELIEIHGDRSCGRLSIVLALLAAATASGESAALVDLGDHFDPQDAKGAGVVLERLLWMRPVDMKQTLHAAETVITGGFPFVVCDLGAPPIRGGRGAQTAWLRLLAAARSHRATLLVSTPYRASGSAATILLEARRGRVTWRGDRPAQRLLEGVGARLTLKKMRGGSPEATADLLMRRGELAAPERPNDASQRVGAREVSARLGSRQAAPLHPVPSRPHIRARERA